MNSSLHSPSRLNRSQLAELSSTLGLIQVQHLLMNGTAEADRVAEPGSPAFDYGFTQADLLFQTLRAAQITQLAT